MADKEIHHYDSGGGGSSGMGAILGVVIGAVLVIGVLYAVAVNWNGGSGGSKVSVNVPAPSAPAIPSPAPSAPAGR